MATTAPFGAAMSQASPLNPQTNSLFYLFFFFCDKKFLNYFDLVSTGDSMILITRSKRVGSLNLIGLSFLISNADFAVWFLRKKIEKRSN